MEVFPADQSHHRTAAIVDLVQQVLHLLPHYQSAQSRGEPEHLVEGEGHEVGGAGRQVQRVGGDEGGGVEEGEPGTTHPFQPVQGDSSRGEVPQPAQRVLGAREVGLSRVGEEVVHVT